MTPREMDAYIAERCDKHEVEWSDEQNDYVRIMGKKYVHRVPVLRYTENMVYAWPVFEWLLENHPWAFESYGFDRDCGPDIVRAQICLTTHIWGDKKGVPLVLVKGDDDPEPIRVFHADTFPMAICKAFVAAWEEIERGKNGAE